MKSREIFVPFFEISRNFWNFVPCFEMSRNFWNFVPCFEILRNFWNFVPCFEMLQKFWNFVPCLELSQNFWIFVPFFEILRNFWNFVPFFEIFFEIFEISSEDKLGIKGFLYFAKLFQAVIDILSWHHLHYKERGWIYHLGSCVICGPVRAWQVSTSEELLTWLFSASASTNPFYLSVDPWWSLTVSSSQKTIKARWYPGLWLAVACDDSERRRGCEKSSPSEIQVCYLFPLSPLSPQLCRIYSYYSNSGSL